MLMYNYTKQFYANVRTTPNTTSVQSKLMPHVSKLRFVIIHLQV